MFNKKRFLPEADIHTLVGLSSQALQARLEAMGTSGVRELVSRMLSSYMIAARVANATWGWYQEYQSGSNGIFHMEEEVSRALHDYSPQNFPKHAGDLEVLCDELSLLVVDMEGFTARECIEHVQSRLDQYQKELARVRGEPPVPRTPV